MFFKNKKKKDLAEDLLREQEAHKSTKEFLESCESDLEEALAVSKKDRESLERYSTRMLELMVENARLGRENHEMRQHLDNLVEISDYLSAANSGK